MKLTEKFYTVRRDFFEKGSLVSEWIDINGIWNRTRDNVLLYTDKEYAMSVAESNRLMEKPDVKTFVEVWERRMKLTSEIKDEVLIDNLKKKEPEAYQRWCETHNVKEKA